MIVEWFLNAITGIINAALAAMPWEIPVDETAISYVKGQLTMWRKLTPIDGLMGNFAIQVAAWVVGLGLKWVVKAVGLLRGGG